MHLLVLFVFATYVAGATLMGNKKCTWGPTYWCSHLNHAKDCGAVQHCMTTVWQNEEIKVKSDETCSYCMFLMEELRQLLEDKATDEEIAAAIADACSLLPAGINRNVCKGIITDDLPIVMKVLASRITPSVICYTVGLCLVEKEENIATEITTLERVSLKYQSPEECEICKDVVAEVDNVLRDKTVQDKIKYEIESVGCAKLGSLADKCKLFVEEYLPELFQLLENILDPETVCEGVGLCMVPSSDVKSKTAFGMTMLKPVPLAKECSDCKLLAQILENLVIRNETVKILEDIGEKICQRLPDQMLKDKCIGIVNEYAPTVLAFFKEEFSPVFICRKLGLCSDWTRKEKRKMTSDDRRLKDDARCKMCKLLIQELKNLIANISTADIVAELNKICHYLPGNYSAKCLQDVRQYITPAIDFLKSSDPQVICGLIQACTSESEIRIPVIQTGKVTGSTECEVCGTILLVLKGLLEQNATREEIVQELKKECSLLPLPSELQAECKSIISQYGGKIVDFFVEKMDPYSICKKIQLCKDTNLQVLLPNLTQIPRPFGTFDLFNRNTSNRKTETSRETASGTKCELCKYIVKEIDNLLQKNASEEEIQYALEKACSLFPAAIRQECKMLTDKYITTIIALLLLELDPQRICYDFDFCMPDSALFNRISSAHLDRDACELCKLLATCLKQEIDSNITIKEAEKLLKELCDYFLPDTITAQCEAIVEMYVPDILDQLKEEFNVTEICKKMGCCMKAENLMVKLAGRSAEEKSKINEALHFKPHKTSSSMDECNKGPSFWCASKENAMHCDATQHCELYVWNRR